MEMRLIENVIRHADLGHKVLFGMDHLGSVHIKVKHGPFKLRTVHYETDVQTAEVIKDQIALLNADDADDVRLTSNRANTAVESAEVPTVAHNPEAQDGNFVGSVWSSEQVLATDSHRAPTPSIPPLKQENSVDNSPVESFRLDEEEINAAWLGLVDGPVPAQAARIWNALSRSSGVTRLAFQTHVSIGECMIWLNVFRRYLSIAEENSSGTYKYSRDPRSTDLAVEVWNKLHGSN